MVFIPLKAKSVKTFRTNIVDGDNRSRPQGRVLERLYEAKRHKWQRLHGITHVWCIDVVRAPVQRSSGRRRTRTGNPPARRRPEGGVSSNSRAQLKTWEPSIFFGVVAFAYLLSVLYTYTHLVSDNHLVRLSTQSKFIYFTGCLKKDRKDPLMSHRTSWETPRGRYDEHSSKSSLSYDTKV
jgi:hypothetical protein